MHNDVKKYSDSFKDPQNPEEKEINNLARHTRLPHTAMIKVLFQIINERDHRIKDLESEVFQLTRELQTERLTYTDSTVTPDYINVLQYAQKTHQYHTESLRAASHIAVSLVSKGNKNEENILLHEPPANHRQHEDAKKENQPSEKTDSGFESDFIGEKGEDPSTAQPPHANDVTNWDKKAVESPKIKLQSPSSNKKPV